MAISAKVHIFTFIIVGCVDIFQEHCSWFFSVQLSLLITSSW
uniref:Uncharacterized protein n=1 Tax=Rhizophora mucronata TaxID=61149 RepID=A0A2P2QHF0_RHIMU